MEMLTISLCCRKWPPTATVWSIRCAGVSFQRTSPSRRRISRRFINTSLFERIVWMLRRFAALLVEARAHEEAPALETPDGAAVELAK